MKKLFLITCEKCDYDQYDGVVVVADSAEEAIDIVKGVDYDTNEFGLPFEGYFAKNQGVITAQEIDLQECERQVILASFNAG